MFVGFFFHLRRRGIKVSVSEWMALVEALGQGLAHESLAGFHHLCRIVCVKSEGLFDLYDQCFAEYFKDVEAPPDLKSDILNWLKQSLPQKTLTPAELERLRGLDLDELRRLFEERLKEQTEKHDGGNRWIGTGGTSPFGHSGAHPSGIRVGGESFGRSAMQVALKRRFKALRGDATLDTRQLSMALKKLRLLAREGAAAELDVDATIDATARNAGDIELVQRAERRNTVRLLLLIDVGGSMTQHAELCERLFSAAQKINHFRELRTLYFHNCVYDDLFTDPYRHESVPTRKLLREVDDTWRLLVVGDAAMNPAELLLPGGCIDYSTNNAEPGVVWLTRLREAMPCSVWLNPEPRAYWEIPSTQIVRKVFSDMQPLTVDGLGEAVRTLRKAGRK